MTTPAQDNDVVAFEMTIHKEDAAKLAAVLRKLDEQDPQLAAALEALADTLEAASVAP